jgi:hypothetical protein
MKKFKVTASYVTECTVEIEAENVDEAFSIAKKMDGGMFESTIDPDDWQIEDVIEVTQ